MICVRCGQEYERYYVFLRDDIADIVEHVHTSERWNLHEGDNDGLCKPCCLAVAPHGAFSTRQEMEPREHPQLQVP